MELTQEKHDRPRVTEQKPLYPLGRTGVPRYFQVGPRSYRTTGTQESQSIFLAARSTYHLLIGLLAQGTKEGKRFCEVGRYLQHATSARIG